MNAVALARPVSAVSIGLGHAVAAVWKRLQHQRRLRETRRYLEEMDEHMLQDIGVSRAQALFDLTHRPGQS